VIEMLVRLGLALFLSLGLAVLLAWGWDSSDDRPTPSHTPFTASDSVALLRDHPFVAGIGLRVSI